MRLRLIGQVFLTKAIEVCIINNWQVISANTDGIEVLVPKNQLDLYKAKGGFFPVPVPVGLGSGNSNESKFDKKTGDLSESYVLKKTETGVAVNWLYKKLHSEKRIGCSRSGPLFPCQWH